MCKECKQFGYTITSKVLFKRVRRSDHMLENPRGWGIQKTLYDKHIKRGDFDTLEIYDKETSTRYKVSAIWFERYRLRDPINRGHGEQYVLPLERWGEERQHQPQLPLL